jgi:hypothetical protein
VGSAEMGRVEVNKDRGGSTGDVEGLMEGQVGGPIHCKGSIRKYETNISRSETARPQAQFLYIHVSVNDLYILTIGLSIHTAAGK